MKRTKQDKPVMVVMDMLRSMDYSDLDVPLYAEGRRVVRWEIDDDPTDDEGFAINLVLAPADESSTTKEAT